MKRLMYQVCLGEAAQSKLYEFCISSVKEYCKIHGIDHYLQKQPRLRIAPDPFMSNRSNDSYKKHGGYLPIYEKENAFDMREQYDQIAIVDADIFIRPKSPNIFDDFNSTWGGVVEREMPLNNEYFNKIINYSKMQYATLNDVDWKWNDKGAEFINMGLIMFDCNKIDPYMRNQSAREFLNRYEFKRFVDGQGAWKWSTDQTLLNWWLKKEEIDVQHMDWTWNGLFSANEKITECNFVHFFLKDKLPLRGEKIDELMMRI